MFCLLIFKRFNIFVKNNEKIMAKIPNQLRRGGYHPPVKTDPLPFMQQILRKSYKTLEKVKNRDILNRKVKILERLVYKSGRKRSKL